MKPIYKMENWGIIIRDNLDPYNAPELRTQSLVGDVIGTAGVTKNVTTSSIIGKFGNYVVTKNSFYDLGVPDPEYEALYPGAKDRVFGSLLEIEP